MDSALLSNQISSSKSFKITTAENIEKLSEIIEISDDEDYVGKRNKSVRSCEEVITISDSETETPTLRRRKRRWSYSCTSRTIEQTDNECRQSKKTKKVKNIEEALIMANYQSKKLYNYLWTLQQNFLDFIDEPVTEKNLSNCPSIGANENYDSNMYGTNFYKPKATLQVGLRPIFIDGSNVAFGHGGDEVFSVRGLKICMEYFLKRGHSVKAFVPEYRLQRYKSTDSLMLQNLVKEKLVVTTPTIYINNQRRIPYDDWYTVQAAALDGGIIVSRDNFHDIVKLQPALRKVVEERRLVPTWVNDTIFFPMDPLGNRQNNLNEFLKF